MNERKKNPVDASKVAKGDLMAFIYFVKVTDVGSNGSQLGVKDLDSGLDITINGKDLVARSMSGTQYAEEVKVTKTEAAELMVHSVHRPFTVAFEKQDGTERVLRGRLIKPEPLMGRSMVEDLDETGKNKVRQVDHRTILWLIVDGVKYIVK